MWEKYGVKDYIIFRKIKNKIKINKIKLVCLLRKKRKSEKKKRKKRKKKKEIIKNPLWARGGYQFQLNTKQRKTWEGE